MGSGAALPEKLAREGCRVALCARGREALESAASAVRALGVETVAITADVTTAEGVQAAVGAAQAAFGGVDVLVNNVGGSTGSSFQETGPEEWQRAIDLNLMSAVRASRLVVPGMRARGGGAIVNIVSIYGREWGGSYLQRPTYIAAKAAEIGMSKALAMELAPFGIRVNAVAPGSIVFPGGGWNGGPGRIRTGSPHFSRPTCRSDASGGPRRWGASWPSWPRTRPAWSSAPA